MFSWISDPQAWLALATLTALEIVLGIDNIIFISILVDRLPEKQRNQARNIGLLLAMGTRILLLLSLTWIMKLTKPLFTIMQHGFSGRDLILIGGGLFLLAKSTHEIHNSLEGEEEHGGSSAAKASFAGILMQIAVIDIVFSLDSVITAVGMAKHLSVMVIAVVCSVLVMLVAAKAIGTFVEKHPTLKMLALSFLILVAVTLLGEGFHFHIPKGYVYFAMAFSVGVEILNLKIRSNKSKPLKLRKTLSKAEDVEPAKEEKTAE
jgi:predicted tellurium resistance membrane protein TerC